MLEPIKIKGVIALHDNVIVADMQFDERVTSAGIVLLRDDSKVHGVHPRWGRVYAVGPEQKDVKVGQFVLIAHGRWTHGNTIIDDHGKVTIRRIDSNDILAVSDEEVLDENVGQGI